MISTPGAWRARRCCADLEAAPSCGGALAGGGAERLVVGEHAELLVGDLVGVARADRAVGVAVDLDLGERRGERVVEEQTADRGLADPGDELDHLGGL